MASLELEDVAVSRAGRRLLDGVDLTVADGARLALLGASGSGKTTLLRAIAGTQPLERGRIRLDGADVAGLEEGARGIALVTQTMSLLPHRDVAGNIGFPLELRRLRRSEVDRRVRAQAGAFSLGGLLRRRTRTLSAGEAAEVALARALVRRSQLLLMDEPFARRGELAREALARDVIEVQEGYGSTLLVATSDQHLAQIIAPTLAVLAGGRIAQSGSPRELVERPASLDVAWLVGGGPLNVLPGHLGRAGGATVVRSALFELPTWDLGVSVEAPQGVQIMVRPGDLRLDAEPSQPNVSGHVVDHTFLGDVVDVTVATEDAQLLVRCVRPVPPIGARVRVTIPGRAVHLFDQDGAAIAHGV